MTVTMLEEKLRPFEEPVRHPFAKWLYLHFPLRPIMNKKMQQRYSKVLEILMIELEESRLTKPLRRIIEEYIRSMGSFLQDYEKKEFPFPSVGPDEILQFLMEENHLSQYDLASDFGGQPVVSDVLRKKRKLTREQIERLSRRFGVSPATFFPAELNDPALQLLAKNRLNEPAASYGAGRKKPARRRPKK